MGMYRKMIHLPGMADFFDVCISMQQMFHPNGHVIKNKWQGILNSYSILKFVEFEDNQQ